MLSVNIYSQQESHLVTSYLFPWTMYPFQKGSLLFEKNFLLLYKRLVESEAAEKGGKTENGRGASNELVTQKSMSSIFMFAAVPLSDQIFSFKSRLLFRKILSHRGANKKSQKLSLFAKMAEKSFSYLS